ncbi:MAG: histidine--tRNA ligase [Candidatus Micrarchaeia archaeon]
MVEFSLPRGTRDYNTSEAIKRMEIIKFIEDVFKLFGFSPIETPTIENLNTLYAKTYGEESGKEIYKIEGEAAALRYDFTVPLARFIAMNRDIPMPFKRYQIGSIFRKDEPQRMRYREFVQADVDIVGSNEIISDVEVIALAAQILDKLGVRDYKILINSRLILKGILKFYGMKEENEANAIRILDKMYKLGKDEVIKGISQLGLPQDKTEALIEFLVEQKSNEENIKKIKSNIGLDEELKRIEELINLLGKYRISGEIVFDLTLARGIDYYTSFVWEFVKYDESGKRLPTIVAGGRYDNLIGLFANENISATGISIGVDRIIEVIGMQLEKKTTARVFVANIGDTLPYMLAVADALRSAGICTDINLTKRGISKQLEYANALKFRYVVIVGESEQAASKVKLRDMISGNEELLNLSETVKILKGD